MNDLDDIYGEEPLVKADEENAVTAAERPMNDEESSEDESDSDVEFVIANRPGVRAEAPASKSQPYAAIKIQPSGNAAEESTKVKKEAILKIPDVDIDVIAELDGKSILEIDLENLERKPWRQPGADITEYFNYGFDEFTWTAYCQKQTGLRQDYTPDKVMAEMMNPMMNMGMPSMMDPTMMMPMDFMGQSMTPSQTFTTGTNPQNHHGYYGSQTNQHSARSEQGAMPLNFPNADAMSTNPVPSIPTGPSKVSRGAYRPRGGSSHTGSANRW